MKIRPRLKSALTFNFLLVAVLPLLVIGVITLHLLTKNLEKEITNKNFLLAKSLAGEVERFLNEPMSLLGHVKETAEKKGLIKGEKIDEFLEMLVRQYAFFDLIQILDEKGMVKYHAPFHEDYAGIDMSGQAFFKETMKSHKPWWSRTFISMETGMPTLTLTRSLRQGMVVGYLNLAALSHITDRVRIGSQGYAAMADQEGITIAHPNKSFVYERLNVKHLYVIRQGLAGREGTFRYHFRGVEKLGSVAIVPQTGWPVVVIQPAEEAFAPVMRIRNIFLGGGALAVILALTIALTSLKKTMRPFSQLIANAKKIADGDYHVHHLPESYPEIDELAKDFKIMSEAIEAREEALRISEEKYRYVVENVNVGILVAQDGKIVYVNPGILDVLGYTEKEFLSHPNPFEYIHPDDRPTVLERYTKRLKSAEVPGIYSYRVATKDGDFKWVEGIGVRIDWEGRPATLSFFTDISERRLAEEEIRQSEKRFRDLFDSINDLIYTQDLEGRFISANPAMTKTFGYKQEEFIGRKAADFMKPGFSTLFESEYLRQLKTKGYYEGITTYFRKDGRKIYIEYHSTLVKPEDREPYISGTGRDVTERVLAERQIKKLQDQMLQSKKMEAIGVLAGGIAHDFNNLLMGIQGNASLMLLDVNPGHPYHEKLKSIEQYVQSGADLTKQLLGFARGGRYEVKPTDLNALIKDQNRMFSRTKKEITIREKYDKGLWCVEVDRGQMEQVLLNLYINAWQAMPGGGDLYVQTENIILDENYVKPLELAPGRYVKISVTDTGIGMDKATRLRIFDPFFTTKEMSRGTGLGLASVYGIIKNHGGLINVYSEINEGTTFNIYLPATELKAGERKQDAGEDIKRGRETILLVDDEDMIIDVGRQMLERLGYEVLTAGSGKEAIDIYKEKQYKIDMVILDMVMPDMSGGATFDSLKEINPKIRALLSSGYSINGQAQDILDRGCEGFIQKPFNMKGLSQKIREILDEK